MSDRLGWDWFPESGHVDAADARLRHGADQLAAGKASLAEATIRAVIEGFPESAVAHSMLAMSLADQGRGREALHAADEALRLNSHLALGHAARACALEALQLPWEAEMEGRQAVALAPTDPNRHSDLAGIVGRAGRFGEALDITARGLSLNPQHLPSLHCRALALVSLGRSDEAEEVLASALLGEVVRSGRRIVGFDLNEVSPSADSEWDANVGARMLYKLIGWRLASLDVDQ